MDITLHIKNLLSRRKKTVGDGRISLYPAMDGEMETTAITDERTRVFFRTEASRLSPKPIKNYKCLAAPRDIRAYIHPR